jgi:dCMP deaminase
MTAAATMKRADLKNRVYMQIAKMLSQLSTCNRLKVGAVLLGFDGSVVGTGYNGSLPGLAHCNEASCNTNQRCLRTRHAERSALDYSQAKVATAYVTHEPCLRCTQDLIARGCKMIHFEVAYYGSPEEAEARARLVQESGTTKTQLHLACHRDASAELPAQSQTPTAENNQP